jgi:hypothetical protein
MNSLHFYSFLCRLKVEQGLALKAAKAYERIVHSLLYSQRRGEREKRSGLVVLNNIVKSIIF